MMFCPKCGSMLKGKSCSCGFVNKNPTSVKFGTNKKKEEIKYDVVEEATSAYDTMEIECPKCKNKKAFFWTQQMRAGDEPETHFFKCTKCDHTWREGK